MPVRISALFVFTAFLLGTFAGTAHTEKRIATACLLGERLQIDSIVIRCLAMAPGWRER